MTGTIWQLIWGNHLVSQAIHRSLVSPDSDCVEMQGLSLRNVGIKAYEAKGRLIYEDFGELLFTHFGISGPTVLSMSAHMRDFEKKGYYVSIDLKPALDEKTLDQRLMSDFRKYSNKYFRNALETFSHLKL